MTFPAFQKNQELKGRLCAFILARLASDTKGGHCLNNDRLSSFLQNKKRSLCVNFFVVVNCVDNTLTGNFSALELLNKYRLLFKRFVLFKKVL
jgi:hypothetical protein